MYPLLFLLGRGGGGGGGGEEEKEEIKHIHVSSLEVESKVTLLQPHSLILRDDNHNFWVYIN